METGKGEFAKSGRKTVKSGNALSRRRSKPCFKFSRSFLADRDLMFVRNLQTKNEPAGPLCFEFETILPLDNNLPVGSEKGLVLQQRGQFPKRPIVNIFFFCGRVYKTQSILFFDEHNLFRVHRNLIFTRLKYQWRRFTNIGRRWDGPNVTCQMNYSKNQIDGHNDYDGNREFVVKIGRDEDVLIQNLIHVNINQNNTEHGRGKNP